MRQAVGSRLIWRWLKDRLTRTNRPTGDESGDRLVPAAEYDFQFGTKSALPHGLRDLKITEMGRDLLLENFDTDLTVDQKYMDRTAEQIAMASRSLQWAKTYHGLSELPRAPIRLHQNNVAIFASHFSEAFPPEENLTRWLSHIGWQCDRPFALHETTTARPLEDGFLNCVRVTVGNVAEESGLSWHRHEVTSNSVVAVLVDFIRRQRTFPLGESCEGYLKLCYAEIPQEQLTHPVFALVDFPMFDTGCVNTTFAGSAWSENELRFWSRPTFFHK